MQSFIIYKKVTARCTPALFILISVALLMVSCTSNQPNQVHASAAPDTLLQIDALLHQRLQAVLNADSAYAQLTEQPVTTAALDSTDETIAQAEIALQKSMDSLQQLPLKGEAANGLQRIISDFKAILQSRRALADLRMVLSANSDDSTNMQRTVLQLRAALQEKDQKIAALERGNSKTSPSNQTVIAKGSTDTGNLNYAPAKGESAADMKQRNQNLYKAYSDLQVKYFTVGRNYLVLKQEHERTLKELAALRQSGHQR